MQDELWAAASQSGDGTADAGDRAGGGGNERCDELAGVYAGGVVEPDSGGGVGLMFVIALFSNVLVGYGSRKERGDC